MTSNQLSAFLVAISYAFGIIVRVEHLGHRQKRLMGIWARALYWYSNKLVLIFHKLQKGCVMSRYSITSLQ